MRSIETQKQVTDSVLAQLSVVDPTAIVSGGAPRDWDQGNLAKDIDVMFYYRPDLSLDQIRASLELAGFKIDTTNDFHNLPAGYAANPNIRCVFNTKVMGEDIQLILYNDHDFVDLIEDFPLNICMIWYKMGEIHKTKHYERAVRFKALVRMSTGYAMPELYIAKIRNKFPSYTYYHSYSELTEYLLDREI